MIKNFFNRSKEEEGFLGIYSKIKFYDSLTFRADFSTLFPALSESDYGSAFEQAIIHIKKVDPRNLIGNYLLISKSKGFRILLEIREARKKKNHIVGIVLSCVLATDLEKIQKEAEVFAQNNENTYSDFPIQDSFSFYTQRGEVFTNFDEVFVE